MKMAVLRIFSWLRPHSGRSLGSLIQSRLFITNRAPSVQEGGAQSVQERALSVQEKGVQSVQERAHSGEESGVQSGQVSGVQLGQERAPSGAERGVQSGQESGVQSGAERASLLENLRVLGVDVQMARRRQPGVLRRSRTNERGLADFLSRKGAGGQEIAGIISRFPRAITRSEGHLEERWRLWRVVFRSDAEVLRVLHRSPESFFRSSDNGDLEENIRYVSSLGVAPQVLPRLLGMAPRILSNSLELNRTMMQLLQDVCTSLGGDDPPRFARTVISRNVYVLIRSTKRVSSNIQFLLEALELSDGEALSLLQSHGAKILDLSHQSLKANYANLQGALRLQGLPRAEARAVVMNYAPVLALSARTLNLKLELLRRGGVGAGRVVERPRVLDCSADTLGRRLEQLRALGYDFDRGGVALLDLSAKRFQAKLERLEREGGGGADR